MDYFRADDYKDRIGPKLSKEVIKNAEHYIKHLGLKRSDFAKGKSVLDIGANTNEFAAVMNELARVAPEEFGAFVMGTDPDPLGMPHDPHLINHDWRTLGFPSDFEGFDTIVSNFAVPLYAGLDCVDENLPDEPEGHVYDFEAPMDHPISRKEAIAHMRRGFENTLSLLKHGGKFLSVPVSSLVQDDEQKEFDKAMILEALEGLRPLYPNLSCRYVEYFTGRSDEDRLVVTISNENAEVGRGEDALKRIYRRYFGPGGLFGLSNTGEDLESGKRVLEVDTINNDLSTAVMNLKNSPNFGAFVVGTNPNVDPKKESPQFQKRDVRNLDFPEDYEKFDTIVSRNGFPVSFLIHLDRSKKDLVGASGEKIQYDFTKPINESISAEEAAAQVEKGFYEMFRWLKPGGMIRCDQDVSLDPYYDIIEMALKSLQHKVHNEHPYMKFGRTGGGVIVVMEDGRDKN